MRIIWTTVTTAWMRRQSNAGGKSLYGEFFQCLFARFLPATAPALLYLPPSMAVAYGRNDYYSEIQSGQLNRVE